MGEGEEKARWGEGGRRVAFLERFWSHVRCVWVRYLLSLSTFAELACSIVLHGSAYRCIQQKCDCRTQEMLIISILIATIGHLQLLSWVYMALNCV